MVANEKRANRKSFDRPLHSEPPVSSGPPLRSMLSSFGNRRPASDRTLETACKLGCRGLLDLDELLVLLFFASGGIFLAGENGISDAGGVDGHGAGRVVVARDHVVDAVGVVVGINHAHHGDAELVGFLNGDLVIADVDHEQSVRKARHVLDAADRLVELLDFTGEVEGFLLGHLLKAAVSDGLLHVLEVLDRLLDGLEVGERAAEPALINAAAAGALSLLDDDVAAAALGVDEEDLAAASGEFTNELLGFSELLNRLFEVDDVNLVAGTEDVLSHLGVPETGLMAEVATGLKHFTHADGHFLSPRLMSNAAAICE